MAKVKVKFLETCIVNGKRYVVGTNATINEKDATVLGPSVRLIKKKKGIEEPPENKLGEPEANK